MAHPDIAREGRLLIATLNDPATRNALSREVYDALRRAIEAAGADEGLGAIVITGAGGFFCSGGNVRGLRERSRAPAAERRASVERLHALILAMRHSPKPIIAAVEGGAAGAGASLAMACDLIVAARDAYFSIAYVRIGLTPDGGATHFLATALPRQLVSEMVFTGERVPVARLHGLGLVNRLAEPGRALAEARALGERLAAGPARAIAAAKRLIAEARLNPLETQLAREADAIVEALGGAEAAEGIAAFLEKRPADFGSAR